MSFCLSRKGMWNCNLSSKSVSQAMLFIAFSINCNLQFFNLNTASNFHGSITKYLFSRGTSSSNVTLGIYNSLHFFAIAFDSITETGLFSVRQSIYCKTFLDQANALFFCFFVICKHNMKNQPSWVILKTF